MRLCRECQFRGYCRKLRCPIATDLEIADDRFIRAVRSHAFDLHIPNRQWPDTLGNWLRDYPGQFVDSLGQVRELHLSALEYPEGKENDDPPYARWYGVFCNTRCLPGRLPRIRKEAWERVRIVATLLRAKHPVRASHWVIVPPRRVLTSQIRNRANRGCSARNACRLALFQSQAAPPRTNSH